MILGHVAQFVERTHLLSEFLALPDDVVGRPHVVKLLPLCLFGDEKPVDAV